MEQETDRELEINKKNETRRLLESIPENLAERKNNLTRTVQGVEALQLQELVHHAVGYNEVEPEKEDLPEPETISRMTPSQIKEMRKIAESQPEHQENLSKQIYEAIIKSYYEMLEFFLPKARKPCAQDMHECVHCGQKFSMTAPKKRND